MGGGMPPGFDPQKMLASAQAGQEALEKELSSKTVEANAGGGMVSAVATAGLDVRSIKIDPSVIPAAGDQGGKEMLEDLVAAAVNAALKKAKQLREEAQAEFQQKQLQQMLGGLGGMGGLGDLGKLLGGG
jgi:DNA-binding YbaB/EbfC family protein